jgi:hypothetical protein
MCMYVCICMYMSNTLNCVIIFSHIGNHTCSYGYVRQVAATADFMKQSRGTYAAVGIATSILGNKN